MIGAWIVLFLLSRDFESRKNSVAGAIDFAENLTKLNHQSLVSAKIPLSLHEGAICRDSAGLGMPQ